MTLACRCDRAPRRATSAATHGTDAFNFQAVGNYDLTPNERTGLFVAGQLQAHRQRRSVHRSCFYHKTVRTRSSRRIRSILAPTTWSSPANQYYNPFGQEFSVGYERCRRSTICVALDRASAIAARSSPTTTDDLVNVGFKGSFGDTSWNWDAHFSYGKSTSRKPDAQLHQHTPQIGRRISAAPPLRGRRQLHSDRHLQSERPEHDRDPQRRQDQPVRTFTVSVRRRSRPRRQRFAVQPAGRRCPARGRRALLARNTVHTASIR